MPAISKPLLKRAAAVAKETGVAVRIEPDGSVTYLPAKKEAAPAMEGGE